MLQKLFFITTFQVLVFLSFGQHQKALITFKDKAGQTLDPIKYFDEKTIERRNNAGVPLVTFYDLPVNSSYVSTLVNQIDSIKMTSRWLNGCIVYDDKQKIEQLWNLPFVSGIVFINPMEPNLSGLPNGSSLSKSKKILAKKQVNRLQIEEFRKQNITGKGVRIAVFDAGFDQVNEHQAFDHIRKRNGFIKTYDFVSKKENVYKTGSHGRQVLSNIAGMADSLPLGLATDAEFLLARTERTFFEPYSEEENWLAAAEWADKNGAMIINSSLGYTSKRYAQKDMTGKKSLVSQAARIATRLGILVVNSAGNEGDKSWKIMGTPADVDSVLSIGGIDPDTDYHINFSSYGPTPNLLMKPNVSAHGKTITASSNNEFGVAFGTSFSSPLIAGFAACAWQAKPNLSNMQIFKEIERSAHLYPYYDYAHGYGIPQASYFTGTKKPTKPTFKLNDNGEELIIELTDTTILNEAFENESDHYLYFHFGDKNGFLNKYTIIKVTEQFPISFYKPDIEKYDVIRIHYRGYTITKDI